MSNAFVTKTRKALIRIGKIAPFIVCFIVGLSYAEDVYALALDRYVEFDDGVYLAKPLSWFIGNYFKYDAVSLLVLIVLSYSIETCIHNKIACLYLGINLVEKAHFDFELEPIYIYVICIINIAVCCFFCYKGIKILLT